MLTFGSLFAGIGGLDLGLERAGMQCKWQVEIDDYATRVLEKHWPTVKRYRDVREVGAHNLEPVDLICGGFPCQDVSVAGKQAGISNGTRSGLWSEYRQIILEIRPKWVLVENVPGLLSANAGRDFGVVLRDLAQGGFDVEWTVLSASQFGAPHIRSRVWIVANSYGNTIRLSEEHQQRKETIKPKHACSQRDPSNANDKRKLQSKRCFENEWEWIGDNHWWSVEPEVDRVVYGVPNGMDRLRCLGNAVVPQVAEWIGRRIMEAEEAR